MRKNNLLRLFVGIRVESLFALILPLLESPCRLVAGTFILLITLIISFKHSSHYSDYLLTHLYYQLQKKRETSSAKGLALVVSMKYRLYGPKIIMSQG